MVERLPIDYALNIRTRILLHRTVALARDAYGDASHHNATTYEPAFMVSVCREFDEVFRAYEAWRDDDTADHKAHLREELAQLAALATSGVDVLGPPENSRWWNRR